MNPKLLALIPLRGGSVSIPKKNIKPLLGKPLCHWVLGAAIESDLFEQVVVSTDSDEIAEVAKRCNAKIEILERPAEFADSQATTESVMLHFAEHYDFEVLFTLQATSPLTTAMQLQEAYAKFLADDLDSLFSGVRVKHFYWTPDMKPINYNPLKRPMRQDHQGIIWETGAFYITKRSILDTLKCRLGGKIGFYELPSDSAVDIDEPSDWVELERRLKQT